MKTKIVLTAMLLTAGTIELVKRAVLTGPLAPESSRKETANAIFHKTEERSIEKNESSL